MMKKGKTRYDVEADILYILGREGPAVTEEVIPGVSVDIDEENREVLGIEILNASQLLSPFIDALRERLKEKRGSSGRMSPS